MAMNSNTLGQAMADALIDAGLVSEDIRSDAEASMKLLAGAIVSHIQTHATVSTSVALGIPVQVAPATGTGATSGPGTGSGSIS